MNTNYTPFTVKLAHPVVPVDIPVAGNTFTYKDDPTIYDEIQEGDPVDFTPEPTNAHDPNAVLMMCRGRKLGYVPGEWNQGVDFSRFTGVVRQVFRPSPTSNPGARVELHLSDDAAGD